jgi:tetratricopeptide (TPR) repeat protein
MASGNLAGYQAAEKSYEQVLAAYPRNADALAGRALTRAGALVELDVDERDARPALELARRAETPGSAPLVEAAAIYLLLLDGQLEEAGRRAREQAALHPDSALLAYLVGRAQLTDGDARAAEDSFRTALKRDPHTVLALYGIGRCQATRGDLQGALLAYDRALVENPAHVATLIARAWLRVEHARDLLEAETDLVMVADKHRVSSSPAQSAWAQLGLAELYAQKGSLVRARTALTEARRNAPLRSQTFWESSARAALRANDIAGAKEDARRAIALSSSTPGPHFILAQALLEEGSAEEALSELAGSNARPTPQLLVLRARARLALGRITEARADLAEAGNAAPELPEVTLTRAQVDLADHEPARAVQSLRTLSEQLPGRADVAEVLGLALAARGEPGARQALERAATLNAHAFAARVALAKLLRAGGRTQDAAQRLLEAVKIRTDAAAERDLAELLFSIGDLAGAQEELDSVFEHVPSRDAPLLLLAAQVAGAAGDSAGADRYAAQAVARGASPAKANKARAQGLLVSGKAREALGPARLAIRFDPQDPEARALYALAQAEVGRVVRAQAYLQKSSKELGWRGELLFALAAISVKMDSPNLTLLENGIRALKQQKRDPRVLAEAYTLLGSAYYTTGEIAHAGAVFDQALALNRHSARANYFQGLLLSESGQLDEARKSFEISAECRPRVPQALFELGQLRGKNGDRDGARKAFGEYLALAPDGDYADDARKELARLEK